MQIPLAPFAPTHRYSPQRSPLASVEILCRIAGGGDVIFLNMSDTDLELLARYTRWNAEGAFAEIVRRHLDLVHSAVAAEVRAFEMDSCFPCPI